MRIINRTLASLLGIVAAATIACGDEEPSTLQQATNYCAGVAVDWYFGTVAQGNGCDAVAELVGPNINDCVNSNLRTPGSSDRVYQCNHYVELAQAPPGNPDIGFVGQGVPYAYAYAPADGSEAGENRRRFANLCAQIQNGNGQRYTLSCFTESQFADSSIDLNQ